MATQSLTRRVRAVILLASIVVLLATAAAFVVFELLSFRTQVVRHLATVASVVANNARVALSFQNPETANDILLALNAERTIQLAVIYDSKNLVFATYPPRATAPSLPKPFPDKPQIGARTVDLYLPVIAESKPVGTLYIRASLSELYERVWNYVAIVAVVLGGSLVLALALSNLLQRRISGPILALSGTTRTIAERGDYSVRAVKKTDDEVGTLTEAFNHMLDQIQHREQALRRSEQALRDQLALVNTITNNTPSCLWMLDHEYRCTFANPASEHITGYTPDELLGKRLHEVVHHKRADGSLYPIEQCPLDGLRFNWEPIEGHEDVFIHREGHMFPVRCNARPIKRDGAPAGIVLEVQDITDIVRARQAIAQQQQHLEKMVQERTAALQDLVQQLETFSYSIVHDMRAPLRTMSAFSKILLEDEGERISEEGRDYLHRIMGGAKRLDALINDVLSYSKVSKGAAPLERIALGELIAALIREYPDLQAHAERIHIKGAIPNVTGNAALLTQCLSNLLGNAVKFVPKQRAAEVNVWAERRDGRVRLWIADNGIGIPDDARGHLFELFHRLNKPDEYPGTGVGLAIVKRAVERMNGSVGLEPFTGQGSQFWIELPGAD